MCLSFHVMLVPCVQHNVLTKLGRFFSSSSCSVRFEEKCLEVKAPCRSFGFIVFLQKSKSRSLWKPAVTFFRCSFTRNPGLILNFKVLLKIDFYAKSVDVTARWRIDFYGRWKRTHHQHSRCFIDSRTFCILKFLFALFLKQQCHFPSLPFDKLNSN